MLDIILFRASHALYFQVLFTKDTKDFLIARLLYEPVDSFQRKQGSNQATHSSHVLIGSHVRLL